jgi:formate--tetrahydrofolate ligase
MPTDLEIARAATMRPIVDVAADLSLTEDDIELYGRYKAKVKLDVLDARRDKLSDKLVLVSAITPTAAGEGSALLWV